MQEEIRRLEMKYGSVPPPWVIFCEHPYSLRWRMGPGEGHMMLWCDWWRALEFSEQQKIEYFQRWPPPHCWLGFLIEEIWDVSAHEESAELDRCFERTSQLGFGSKIEYERDLDDPKWLDLPE